MSNRLCRLMGMLWFGVCASAYCAAQTSTCPQDIPDNSTLYKGPPPNPGPTTFAASATLNVYIDTNSFPARSIMNTAISLTVSAWDSYQQSLGGNFNIVNGPLPTGPLPTPYQVFALSPTPLPTGNDATTTWTVDPGTGYVNASTTVFDPTLAASVNASTSTPGALPNQLLSTAGLASHEFAQPYGFGDCIGLADCVFIGGRRSG
jgi:hypothetical protein